MSECNVWRHGSAVQPHYPLVSEAHHAWTQAKPPLHAPLVPAGSCASSADEHARVETVLSVVLERPSTRISMQ